MRPRFTKAASCILLGLRMHVLSGAPSSLLVDGAVIETASEFFGPWDTTADLLSEKVGTFTVNDEQTLRDVDNTDLRVLLSNSDIIEETDAQLEDGATQGNTEDARKNARLLATQQKSSDTSRFVKPFYVSVFVALCLCFLALQGKGFPTFEVLKRSRILERGGVDDELRSRLKALRALIPLAGHLAKAVKTEEAHELLQAVHANVPKEGEGDGKAGAIHEENVKNAFSAMRGLQQAAVKEAGNILQKNFDNLSNVSSFLKEWEKGYLGEKEAGEMSPLITALRVSHNHFLRISQHMQEVYGTLEQAQSFEDEQVIDSFLSTTDGFLFILKLQEEREDAAYLAREQRTKAGAAMRNMSSRKTSRGFRQLWGEVEIARAYVNIAREAGAAAAAEGESAAELQGHLDKVELRLTEYKEELRRLLNSSLSKPRDSITGTLTHSITLQQEQESLGASLANYWVAFENHVKMPGKLEDSGRESVKFVLRRALQRISQDRDTMDDLFHLITLRLSQMAQVFDDPEMTNQLTLYEKENRDILHRRMAAEMLNFLGRAEGRMIQLESLLQSLDQEEDTEAAAEMMKHAAASAVESSDELAELRLSLLRINVLISAAQIANNTMQQATELSKELRGLISDSSMEPNKLELLLLSVSQLESMLAQNYWEARNAAALEGRIKAAGQMQELTLSLRHILYLVKNNSFP
ncbi:hypothetical protein Emed_002612 [Eimeria media]